MEVSLPPLAQYPSTKTRSTLPPDEWQACLEGWLLSVEYRLRLTEGEFVKSSSSPRKSGLDFIRSYLNARPEPAKHIPRSKEAQLHQRIYLLLRRLLLSPQIVLDGGPQVIHDFLLGSGSVFQSADFSRLVTTVSQQSPKQFSAAFDAWKTSSMKLFAIRAKETEAIQILQTMNVLLRSYHDAGPKLMAGSDYLEALMQFYVQLGTSTDALKQQQTVVEHLFLSLRNLMADRTRHPSLLLDQLYALRTDADSFGMKKAEVKTLLAELLCTSSFLRHLVSDAAVMDTKRGQDMFDALMAYREQTRQLFPVSVQRRRKTDKGKAKAVDQEEMHIHQAAQVSQIHELFPDLSDYYIMRLLDHYENDVEQTTAALLEPASLPPHLQDPNMQPPEEIPRQAKMQAAVPVSSVPQRQNVFDNDDFDRMKISAKQLHKGRRKIEINDPELPDEKSRSKAAILAALSAIDTEDDERDDTYDEADVGGSVDRSVDTDQRPAQHEEVLYRAWKDSTALFARDSKTRISPIRQDLKRQTGMSDEQIEGWAIMLARDPATQRRLQQKYSVVNSFRGNQNNLQPTSWKQSSASADNSLDESDDHKQATGDESDASAGVSPSNSIRGRGRGRGGAFAHASGEHSAPSDRGRGRGRGRGGRANHNRREGRARKMGRGMAGPPA